MSPASPSGSRLKWRKRKRDANRRRQKPHEDEEDEEEDDEDAAVPVGGDAEEVGPNSSPIPAAADPVLDLRESEVLSDGGQRISVLPTAFRRTVNRPHASVLALVAAERSNSAARSWSPPFLENISHGQLQVLSAVLPDNPSLQQPPNLDKPSTYVCTPLPLMEGKGMIKRLDKEQLLIVPMHSDWFSPSTVHRLERQVVPHFFLGKSNDHTLEKYIRLRNKIISKYLENPGKRLSFADCQALVPNKDDLYDLSRIVRFLDHWGIINYLAASSVHRGLRMAGSLLREDANGELQLQTAPLRSIDSLILFDRPKCSIRLEDVALLCHSGQDSDALVGDLDGRIRERIAEHTCNFCSCPLTKLHYQSQKEVDIMLCSNCFHDAKFVTGHSSLDFVRMDSVKENSDLEGDSWTDHETLLLLEAMEKYNDNWNEIAEYIGSKSKAQCILHFLRLPMENGLLESIELQHFPPSESLDRQDDCILSSNSNGKIAGNQDLGSANSLPFINSSNPVMSLVAFLTSAVGPRVAAACASAALSILTRDDSRNGSENSHVDVDTHAPHAGFSHQKDGTVEGQLPHAKNGSTLLSSELVEHAAMAGLSAAAMKAKLFADQEEREIQRLAATIINHQLKRLELKLKQFAELETLLLKECEQAERVRQRLSAERSRMMTSRFGASPNSVPSPGGAAPAGPAAAAASMGANPIPGQTPIIAPATGQASFGNNLNPSHRQMPLMQRQQMFGLGPRLPLSAIHQAPASQNTGFNSAIPNSSTPNHHPLSRSSSSGNTRI